MTANNLSLNSYLIARALFFIAASLVGLSILSNITVVFWGEDSVTYKILIRLFNLDAERSVPAGFSAFLLFFSSVLLFFITTMERKSGSFVIYWSVLSFGFLVMAVDEAFSYHEYLTFLVLRSKYLTIIAHDLFGAGELGLFYYAWVFPALVGVAFIALFFVRFLFSLPLKTRIYFLVSALIYLGGAIGMELAVGKVRELNDDVTGLMYILMATVEESLEMIGVILFIWSLMVYISENYKAVSLSFE